MSVSSHVMFFTSPFSLCVGVVCGVPPVFFFCFFLYIFFLFRCLCGGFMRAREYIDSHGGLGVLRGCFFSGFVVVPSSAVWSLHESPLLGMSDESRAIPPPLFFPVILFFFVCGGPGSYPAGHPAGVWMGVVSTHICEEDLSAVFSA